MFDMGAPQEVIQDIFTVIEGGSTIGTAAEIIQFPSDSGTQTFTAVQKTFQGTNGVGLNYWVAAVVQGTAAISAGALMVTVALPEFMALAVPCLGIAVGTAWYNIDPDGWTNLAELLMDAGWTIKNKVVGFMVEDGTIAFPEDEIEILKDELCRLGAFDIAEYPEYAPAPAEGIEVETNIDARTMVSYALTRIPNTYAFTSEAVSKLNGILDDIKDYNSLVYFKGSRGYVEPTYVSFIQLNPPQSVVNSSRPSESYTITMKFALIMGITTILDFTLNPQSYLSAYTRYFTGEYTDGSGYLCASSVNGTMVNNENLQDFAKLPTIDQLISEIFPTWIPWEFPEIPGWNIPKAYPCQYPDLLPSIEPYQEPAQNPDADPAEQAEKAQETLEDPRKNPASEEQTEDVTDPDPDPQPEPEEELPEDDDVVDPDPIDPDPPPTPSPVIPAPSLPTTVGSSKLFTVYNPSITQLGQLGNYLWDDNLMEILKKIWQNPLDGIISLIQVYVTPDTSGSNHIILGYLDSNVSAPVVSNQFKTIDCGTITIPELNENCLDYIPYTKLQLYLPFIGITEIDTNEFMSGSISVTYKVDVYTGTCLAEVKCTRSRDLDNGAILYTFSGNCSQQIPLTSGDARGVFGALVSAVGLGLSVATGGATAMMVAGSAAGLASKEMLHVSHSGNLSANAGIMGQKKPYLIINRERPYTANNYSSFYGYPANKTINIGNYSGFLKVKACKLKGSATETEKQEIMELLTSGIFA